MYKRQQLIAATLGAEHGQSIHSQTDTDRIRILKSDIRASLTASRNGFIALSFRHGAGQTDRERPIIIYRYLLFSYMLLKFHLNGNGTSSSGGAQKSKSRLRDPLTTPFYLIFYVFR